MITLDYVNLWIINIVTHYIKLTVQLPFKFFLSMNRDTTGSTNFNGATVEVWEWIDYFILNFIVSAITYPC